MNQNFVLRETYTYPLPLASGISILRPELAVLKFGKSKTVDVGFLCYTERSFPDFYDGKHIDRFLEKSVKLSSLSLDRVKTVQQLLIHMTEVAEGSGRRALTQHDSVSRLCAFINWADANSWPDVLRSVGETMPALHAYLEFVRDRVARGEIGLNHGAKQQSVVVSALAEFFDTPIRRGLTLLKRDPNNSESTVPPSDDVQGKALSLCDCVFEGISEFVLEGKNFPYAMKMPKYLAFPMDQLWVFPGNSWFKTPAMIEGRLGHAGYDYVEGRLATTDELKIQYPSKKYHHTEVKSRAKEHLDNSNTDLHHKVRKQIAMQAFQCFLILFLAATAMNWAQVVELRWSDDYEVLPTKQGFRTIKWRAQGKEVTFELPVVFLPKFKRFLALREYCQSTLKSDYLFFSKLRYSDEAGQILSTVDKTYKMLRRIDPSLSNVMPREWRAAKSDWLVRKKDPSTAALVLQNTERTVLKHYAAGSETLHHEEMSHFLSDMVKAVVSPNNEAAITQLAAGKCLTFGKPAAITNSKIVPDCARAEGCLFCDKFKVHADEEDTRKLLSCRSVIAMTSPLSDSEESFQEILGPVFARIDSIVADINARDPEMVTRVTREVDVEGELDIYWAAKAEMLTTLGLN